MLLLLLSVNCFSQTEKENYAISGRLILDDVWERAIYLSYIPSINERYSLSNEIIITGSSIDSTGYFSFDVNFLPKEDHLFRLHIVKKKSPVSSLIIGGREQNHMFIVANNSSNIFIEGKDELFTNVLIKGSPSNMLIQQIDSISNTADNVPIDASALQRKFSAEKVYQELKRIADTTNHSLVSLYALYKKQISNRLSKR